MSASFPDNRDKDNALPPTHSTEEHSETEHSSSVSPKRAHKRKALSIDLLAASPNAKLKNVRQYPGVNLPHMRNYQSSPLTARFSSLERSVLSGQFAPGSPLSYQPISPYPFGSDAFEFYRGQIESTKLGSPITSTFELPTGKSEFDLEHSLEGNSDTKTLFVQSGDSQGAFDISREVDSLLQGNLFSPTITGNSVDITTGQREPPSASRFFRDGSSLLDRLNNVSSSGASPRASRTPVITESPVIASPKWGESLGSKAVGVGSGYLSMSPRRRENFETLTLSPLSKEMSKRSGDMSSEPQKNEPPIGHFVTSIKQDDLVELPHMSIPDKLPEPAQTPDTAVEMEPEASRSQDTSHANVAETESEVSNVRKKRSYRRRKPLEPRKASRRRRNVDESSSNNSVKTITEVFDIEWRRFVPLAESPDSDAFLGNLDGNNIMKSLQPMGSAFSTKNTKGSKLINDEGSTQIEDAKITNPLPHLFLNSVKQELESDPFVWLVKAVISCANPTQALHLVESGEFPTVMLLLLDQKSPWEIVSLVVLIRLVTSTRQGKISQLSFLRIEILSLLFQILQGPSISLSGLQMVQFWNSNPKMYSYFMSTIVAVSNLPCMGKNAQSSIFNPTLLEGQVSRFVERFEPHFLKVILGESLPPFLKKMLDEFNIHDIIMDIFIDLDYHGFWGQQEKNIIYERWKRILEKVFVTQHLQSYKGLTLYTIFHPFSSENNLLKTPEHVVGYACKVVKAVCKRVDPADPDQILSDTHASVAATALELLITILYSEQENTEAIAGSRKKRVCWDLSLLIYRSGILDYVSGYVFRIPFIPQYSNSTPYQCLYKFSWKLLRIANYEFYDRKEALLTAISCPVVPLSLRGEIAIHIDHLMSNTKFTTSKRLNVLMSEVIEKYMCAAQDPITRKELVANMESILLKRYIADLVNSDTNELSSKSNKRPRETQMRRRRYSRTRPSRTSDEEDFENDPHDGLFESKNTSENTEYGDGKNILSDYHYWDVMNSLYEALETSA